MNLIECEKEGESLSCHVPSKKKKKRDEGHDLNVIDVRQGAHPPSLFVSSPPERHYDLYDFEIYKMLKYCLSINYTNTLSYLNLFIVVNNISAKRTRLIYSQLVYLLYYLRI